MNDFDRKRVATSFEMIKKISMERAEIINDGDINHCCISLLFSTFIELFIDEYPPEHRLEKLNEFFLDIGKPIIEDSIKKQQGIHEIKP